MISYFNRFEITMTRAQAESASHSGQCDADVAVLAKQCSRSRRCTPEALRLELKEYGAWDETELQDDAANRRRILWLAAGDIRDGV